MADGVNVGRKRVERWMLQAGITGMVARRRGRSTESDGVVSTHGRHGTVVAEPPSRATPPPELLDAARSYADRAAHTGATLDDALTAGRVAFAAAAAS